jgi:hypothetical protein
MCVEAAVKKKLASRCCVRPGRSSRPISRFPYRLCAPLVRFRGTTAHIAVLECCKLALRIRAMLRIPYPREAVTLRSDRRQIGPSIAFELACIEGIQKLSQEPAWCDQLDLQVYARGSHEGAQRLANTSDSGGSNGASCFLLSLAGSSEATLSGRSYSKLRNAGRPRCKRFRCGLWRKRAGWSFSNPKGVLNNFVNVG